MPSLSPRSTLERVTPDRTSTPKPPSTGNPWLGHLGGSRDYRRIQLAMLCAGFATFAQLYAPQALLPEISTTFDIDPATAALMVSMGTLGVAVSVLPWSIAADRMGRVRAITISISSATVLGLLMILMPSFELALVLRLLEGLALGGVPACAIAYLNEELHPTAAAGAAGTFVAGNTLGGLGGRIVPTPVAELLDWRLGLLTVSLISVAMAVLFIWLIPKPRGFAPLAKHAGGTLGASIGRAWKAITAHLSSTRMLGLFAQGFFLMGGFVAVYNFLGFHLTQAPYFLPVWLVSLVFVTYLAGSFSSPFIARLAGRHGRKIVLLASAAVSLGGLALTLAPQLWLVIAGLSIFTAAFFGAHSVAVGWAGAYPTRGRAQATALYNLGYYGGSSIFGFLGGVFFQHFDWPGVIWMVGGLTIIAGLLALFLLPWKGETAATQAVRVQ